ncbi:MAG: alpha/beta hydrolase [Novosphingobium sp.]
MKALIRTALAAAAFLAAPALAENPPTAQNAPAMPPGMGFQRIDPVIDPAAIPLYPGMKPGKLAERWNMMFGAQRVVRNVTVPTLTPVLPNPALATGAAVIVIPGGGFKFVSMDNEGWPVARWLADRGIAAFILKYRTNETPDAEADLAAAFRAMITSAASAKPGEIAKIEEPRATEDALAALAMVRRRAGEWKVDPARLGIIGFSAGAMTALNAARAADPAARPAYFGYIYGPMARIEVTPDAPPMFAALAIDDPLFGKHGFGIVDAWREAKRPVELHVYQKGSHGFGLGMKGTTTTAMIEQYRLWLESNGWLKGK